MQNAYFSYYTLIFIFKIIIAGYKLELKGYFSEAFTIPRPTRFAPWYGRLRFLRIKNSGIIFKLKKLLPRMSDSSFFVGANFFIQLAYNLTNYTYICIVNALFRVFYNNNKCK